MTDAAERHRPLRGRRVLIAASPHTAPVLAERIERLGGRVELFPALEIRPLGDTSALDAAIEELERYDWIVFTSGYGVRYFLSRFAARGGAAGAWRPRKVCAVGPATARALAEAGIAVSLVPRDFSAEGILAAFAGLEGGLPALDGARILLPRAREGRDVLPRELEAAGALVEVVPCYENVLPEVETSALRVLAADPPELLVFTSSSALQNFVRLLGEETGRRLLAGATVAALGPVTAATATGLGKKVDIVPEENTTRELVRAIARHYGAGPEETLID